MTVEFEDHFAEPTTNTVLQSHAPDTTGSSWAEVLLSGNAHLQALTATNTVATAGAGISRGVGYIGDVILSDADYDVELLIVTAKVAGSDDPLGVIGRYQDVDNFYTAAKYQDNSSTDVRLYSKTTASGYTELANADAGTALDGKIIKLVLVGSAISVVFDGVTEISSHSNSDHSAAGQGGLAVGSALSGISTNDVDSVLKLDDFIITVTGGDDGPIVGLRTLATTGAGI